MVVSRYKYSLLLLTFIFNSFLQLKAQSDSSALIPQKAANTNSRQVSYPSAKYRPAFVTSLSGTLNETSGLLFFDRQIWTINDSGNKPEIYQLDSTTGAVLRTVVVRNSVNTDWESITQDDSSVYIGDFGNNAGIRTDLHILKIPKTELLNHVNDSLDADYIYFSYPDQTDFNTAYNKNNFDCEASFCHNDSLHLFSKNWSDLKTKHYVLPVEAGNYKARLAGQFDADGLITDASVNVKGNIVLLGYKKTKGRNYTCFTWLLSGYKGTGYFEGIARRVELGSPLHLGQTEGIVLKNDNTGWISAESIRIGCVHKPAKLFGFDLGKYFEFRE